MDYEDEWEEEEDYSGYLPNRDRQAIRKAEKQKAGKAQKKFEKGAREQAERKIAMHALGLDRGIYKD